MWHSVALSSAIPKTQKCKKTILFNVQDLDVALLALCGAIWPWPTLSSKPTLSSNPKSWKKKTQTLQISRFGCGTMWRYPTLSSNPKYSQKHRIFKFQKLDVALLCGAILKHYIAKNTIFKFPGSMWHNLALPDAIPKPKTKDIKFRNLDVALCG